jgi:hypothetical protein
MFIFLDLIQPELTSLFVQRDDDDHLWRDVSPVRVSSPKLRNICVLLTGELIAWVCTQARHRSPPAPAAVAAPAAAAAPAPDPVSPILEEDIPEQPMSPVLDMPEVEGPPGAELPAFAHLNVRARDLLVGVTRDCTRVFSPFSVMHALLIA